MDWLVAKVVTDLSFRTGCDPVDGAGGEDKEQTHGIESVVTLFPADPRRVPENHSVLGADAGGQGACAFAGHIQVMTVGGQLIE
jgi:hypothetical protein